ncbi:hypothetical protein QYE76_024895 [Lolium multiflorum]|uniref:RNase H type-1 domain-containing protein n=1 Tax=Lolium multiflorum TaxID=4521 RepID=A0AAD8RHJ1_LOLMU|nr:hypothetical protein QYE76_024895 [Lolium multiflorum]
MERRCLKDVQKFTSCLASLSRFVSRLGEKALPLYQLLKKSDKFTWSPQADEAFRDLKRVLSTAPILATPASMEPMLLYIAATNRVQNYPHYQKVTYGVYMAAKKLKHYFQEHPIKVVATAPLAEIIGSKDANGRVAKWALELAAHTILYEARTAIKSQILADFFVDWAEMQYLPPVPDSTHWKMHFDGSKMRNGLGAGIVITSPKGDRLDYVLQIHFAASNNVAEYEALIHGLKLAKEMACVAYFASATPTWSYSKHLATGTRRTPTWPRTASTSSSYPASSTAANFTMCHEQTTRRLTPCPRSAQPGKPFRRVSPWRFSRSPSHRHRTRIQYSCRLTRGCSADPGLHHPSRGLTSKPAATMPNPGTSQPTRGFIAQVGG